MDVIILEQIRSVLLKRQTEIDVDLEKNLMEHMEAGLPQAEIIDIAQAIEQRERDKTIADQERRELLETERALSKIAAGTFGSCEECGEEIPHKRLMAVPSTRFCAGCQSIEERIQARTHRARGSMVAW